MRRILEPQLTDDQKRADQRRDPTDPPKPCALVPVAPKVESEPAPQSARDRLRDAAQGLKDKAGPVAKALAIFAAITATLTAATPLVKELREWTKEESTTAPSPTVDKELHSRVSKLERNVQRIYQTQRDQYAWFCGYLEANGLRCPPPTEGDPPPSEDVTITPRPKLARRSPLVPVPEVKPGPPLPEPLSQP